MLQCFVIAFVLAQPPLVSPPKLVTLPPLKSDLPKPSLTYSQALAEAKSMKKPIVLFVGVPVRDVSGALVFYFPRLSDGTVNSIVVSSNGEDGYWLSADATDADIRRRLEVSRLAVPFDPLPSVPQRIAQREAVDQDHGLWLDSEEDAKVRAIWPAKVEFPKGLRFYNLAPRYQNLYTMNNGTFKGRDIDPLHHEHHPFLVSGGMAELSGWGSVKGMVVPEGKKIKVWEELVDVRAFALVPRYRWKFPEGTQAFDVLYTKKGIFEIRSQERTEDGWETAILHKDAALAPEGYKGAGASCASCHSHTAEVVSVPGRIYLRSRWGDDGRFSWRPFNESGQLDYRWPIERK